MGPTDPEISALHAKRAGRVCEYTTCTTRLSRYNPGDYCTTHEYIESWRVLPSGDLRPREDNNDDQ